MAKKSNSSLPKVISKANKEISTLLETDIQRESELLKDLVDQVLQSNLEVKKRNNLRITETKRKLSELDEQIDGLNVEIDLVDRETVIQQLNEMIDAENKIFNARQEIRYFDNENLPSRLETLDEIYKELTASIERDTQSEAYRDVLIHANNKFLEQQINVSKQANKEMSDIFKEKRDYVDFSLANLNDLKTIIENKEQLLQDILQRTINETISIISNSTAHFATKDDDVERLESLEVTYNQRIEDLNTMKSQEVTTYEEKKNNLIEGFKQFEINIKKSLESSNLDELNQEKAAQEKLDEQLKQIQLKMMQASQAGHIEKAADLLKEYEQLQKNTKSKTTNKVKKETSSSTQKERTKTLKELKQLELDHVTNAIEIDFELQLAAIELEESKVLYKFQNDYHGLVDLKEDTTKQISMVRAFIHNQIETRKELAKLKLELRLKELDILKENEIKEQQLIEIFERLLLTIKKAEQKRIAIISQNTNSEQIIQVEYEYRLKRAILDIKLSQQINEIEKLILRKRNETLIKNEKLHEELNSEVIYQESLIKIAQKEHELQLIKVRSLYENERSLAEEQVERINLGVQVNDTFVKTTLKNQMLFATQQINCAESEYEIRLESISLTHSQEVKYANKKIEYYKQKYEYDKNKIRKELDDKLEDLNYRLLLFTEDKERNEITSQIDRIRQEYEDKISTIEELESQDQDILRYEKVIQEADNRQQQAISEALGLKTETIESFDQLLEATKERYSQLEKTETSEDTKGILPLINNKAISSADQRLQQAIKEADELYNERVIEPERIIKETKERMIELMRSDESDQFIDAQKTRKKEIIKLHKEQCDFLEKEKESIKEPLLSLTVSDSVGVNDDISVKVKSYRSVEDITKDYDVLYKKENDFYLEIINNLKQYKKETRIRLIKLERNLHRNLNGPIKPYSKYLTNAAKEYTKQKKTLRKTFDQRIRKSLKDSQKNLIEEI